MFKVSQRTEYALRAMIELAERRGQGPVPAREIAETQRVPLRFLEQQLAALSKAGLVLSHRGAGGGCELAADPGQMTVASVVDAIEGPLYPMYCMDPTDHTCVQDARCGIQGLWGDVNAAVRDVFERTTVADLASRHKVASLSPVFPAAELLKKA